MNIGTMNHRVDFLHDFLISRDITFMGINETWLDSIFDSAITSSTHSIIRQDRSDRLGGGVLIFYKNWITATHIITHLDCNTGIEFVCARLRLTTDDDVHIISIYRPPNIHRNCITTVLKFLAQNLVDAQHLILFGDLNLDIAIVANLVR